MPSSSKSQTPISASPTRLDSALSLMSLKNGGTPVSYNLVDHMIIENMDHDQRPLKKQPFQYTNNGTVRSDVTVFCSTAPSNTCGLDSALMGGTSHDENYPKDSIATPRTNPHNSLTPSPALSETSSSVSSTSERNGTSVPCSFQKWDDVRVSLAAIQPKNTTPIAPPPSPQKLVNSPANAFVALPQNFVSPRSRDATITKYSTSSSPYGSARDSNRPHPYHIHQQLFPPLTSTGGGAAASSNTVGGIGRLIPEPLNSQELRRRLKIVKKERGQLSTLPEDIKNTYKFVF